MKIIRVEKCEGCPYCMDGFCNHPELGGWQMRMENQVEVIPSFCPLPDDEVKDGQ